MSIKKTIILASTSPRRRELLRQIGIEFTTDPADVDERVLSEERPEDYAVRVAREKAKVVAQRASAALIIAADTIVVLGDTILGKPVDAADAERMLGMLSGRMHRVLTGLVVMDSATGKVLTRLADTRVWFRDLSAEEIHAYVTTREPLDKAGAYGIQDKGALLIRKIEGCYFNVVGLPLALLAEMFAEFGIQPLSND
jgi:septum formation protein